MARRKRRQVPSRPHVALIVETSLASGREVLRGIARYVREHGPWSIYHEPRSLEESVPAWLKKWKGDGIIARLQNKRITAAVVETGLPSVDVLGVAPDARVPLVHTDNVAIAQLAAGHLLQRAFTHFGYCGIRGINWSGERRDTFVETVAAAGYPCSVYELSPHSGSTASWETEQDRLARWVQRLPKPAGVMACNDPRGQRVLEACRRAGVLVPEEVAVIGVDNDVPVCEVSDPPLSSIDPDIARVGYEAAKLLDQFMQGKAAPERPTYFKPAGVTTRRSTDVLAIDDVDMARAVRFIREYACSGIDVGDVVEHVAMSRSALKRRFACVLGRSIHDEIIRVRISRACELLAETQMPFKLIAEKTGFCHQEYMGVVFKAKVGKTPARYRRDAQS